MSDSTSHTELGEKQAKEALVAEEAAILAELATLDHDPTVGLIH